MNLHATVHAGNIGRISCGFSDIVAIYKIYLSYYIHVKSSDLSDMATRRKGTLVIKKWREGF